MKYLLYSKPYQTPLQLITKLKNDGLQINDLVLAEKTIAQINYFRFKIYLRPLMDLNTKVFRINSTFEEALQLYRFDDELRDYLFSIIGRIEIKLRSRIDQIITQHTDPFWYLDDSLFLDKNKIFNTRVTLKNEFLRSKDDFVLHYKDKYLNEKNNDFKEMPPFWVISELATFGNLLTIIEIIDKVPFTLPHNQNILDKFSNEFGAKNLKELNSWLKLMRDIRNRCAHHSRVWNSNYREPSGVRSYISTSSLLPTKSNKIYLFLIVLEKIDQSLDLGINIHSHLKQMFMTYPKVQNHHDAMGIPSGWLV